MDKLSFAKSVFHWNRNVLVTLASLAFGCAGGTGTGSSGLISTEGVLVSRVIETGECEKFDGVDYCPADSPDALPSGKYISTPFDESSSVGCFKSESGSALCVFVFSFEPQGFDEQEEFVIGVREAGSDDPWELTSLRDPADEELDDVDLIISVVVVDLADGAGDELQLAILAFDEPVVGLPAESETLAQLGAEVVFVAPPIEAIAELPDEEAAIDEVRATQDCVAAGVANFCPTGVTFEAGRLGPLLGPPPIPSATRVEFEVPSPLPCVLEVGNSRCTAEIEFSVVGDLGFYYRMASRVHGADDPQPWRLGEEVDEPAEFDVEEVRTFVATATVELTGIDTNKPIEIDLVVLVDPLDPLDLPREIQSLNEAVPAYVFLPGPLTIELVE